MAMLEEMNPRVEIYSIDEAFFYLIRVRNCRDLEEFGHELKDTVRRNTGLAVGIGIAQKKILDKLVNHAAKTWAGHWRRCRPVERRLTEKAHETAAC